MATETKRKEFWEMTRRDVSSSIDNQEKTEVSNLSEEEFQLTEKELEQCRQIDEVWRIIIKEVQDNDPSANKKGQGRLQSL